MWFPSQTVGMILVPVLVAGAAELRPTIPVRADAPPERGYDQGVLGLQLVLDRAGFAPGLLDGHWGPKTRRALMLYRTANRRVPTQVARPYRHLTITRADAKQVGRLPTTWRAKSRATHLPYPSLLELVSERCHAAPALLGRLNPDHDLSRLEVGTTLMVPNVTRPAKPVQARQVRIFLGAKVVALYAGDGTCLASFPCSIAARAKDRPVGTFRVVASVPNPAYTFDPRMFPEVRGVRTRLRIPPGPRNPVGVWWIGLSKRGYGIHGTPSPQDIGKTGSHGCFRMANWDATCLGQMVKVGTTVVVKRGHPPAVASAAAPHVRR